METRLWNSGEKDSGSIHCTGNGRVCAYGQGPELVQVFGGSYFTPSFFSLRMRTSCSCLSVREAHTALWRHELLLAGKEAGVMNDFTDPVRPVFFRRFAMAEPFEMELESGGTMRFISESELRIDIPRGSWVFAKVCTVRERSVRVTVKGGTFTEADGKVLLRTERGKGLLTAAFDGENVPDADTALEGCRNMWKARFRSGTAPEKLVPASFPHRELLTQAADSVSVLIRCQQAAEGAVLAGHNYHLGYVRDQYGVSRCLLDLGFYSEARSILGFYLGVFRERGMIRNAQAAEGAFHVHEHDDSEITGYLILQAFDYLAATGDGEFVRELLPMLVWAFDRQTGCLYREMMPFNGDETYIAGGVLPRVCMDHGSMEATLLYIEGGRRLAGFLKREGNSRAEEMMRRVDLATGAFGDRFIREGRLCTNNPARDDAGLVKDRLRHGVCEVCNAHYGFILPDRDRHYKCPGCIGKPIRSGDIRVYELASAALTPLYIGSGIVPADIMQRTARRLAKEFGEKGNLPSRPDGAITVGYDYGLLLYALAASGLPLGETLTGATLGNLDETGAWVEYYHNNAPMGTRCRPWESGINLSGLLAYARMFYC